MEYPLGFRLNTISKGLLVSYTLRGSPELIAPGAPLGQGWKDDSPPHEGAKSPTQGSCLCWTLAMTVHYKSAAACNS